MKRTARFLSLLLAVSLSASCALADSISINGTVTAAETSEVYAPIGGTVASVAVEAGQEVAAGDVLYTLRTSKVYAEEDGTVTGIFGEPGDSADTVSQRYGAVLYLEGNSVYTVSASTDNAYNSTSTKFVHVGETVYLECRSNSNRTGAGVITAIEGTSYTVEVRNGTFIPGDSVDIFRDSAFTNSRRVGRGTVQRKNPTAVTASGSIVRIAVSDGDVVKRGDLLLETLDGSFDGLYMSGEEVRTTEAGIIQTIRAEQGSSLQKDSVAAVLYSRGSMRIEAELPEDSLRDLSVGDPVSIELESDESKTYEGTVTMISGIASEAAGQDSGVTYRVFISFTPDSDVRYGMSVIVTTPENLEPEEEPQEEPAEEPEEEPESQEKEGGSDDQNEEPESRQPREGRGGDRPEGAGQGFPEAEQQHD